MKAVALALLLALPAFADDAPRLDLNDPLNRIALAQRLASQDGRIASLEASVKAQPSTALVVVLVVAAAVVAGVGGFAVGRATAPK